MALGAVVIVELVALLGLGLLEPTGRSLRRLLRFRERSAHQRAYAGDHGQAYRGHRKLLPVDEFASIGPVSSCRFVALARPPYSSSGIASAGCTPAPT